MANVKISDLTAYTDPVATDVLPIVDLVNDQTKKVKVEDLLKKFGAGTEALPSFAFTGDLDTGIYSPGANQLAVSTGGTQRLLIDASGNTTIQGDLTVNGTSTTIQSTTLSVDDKNIELGTVSTPSDTTADGGGITLKGTTDHTIIWTNSTDSWDLSEHTNISSGKEFRIAGTKVLDATSLGSAVVSSSLTSVGTIGTGVWNGTPIATAYIANGSARQLLQTNSGGTGVEFTSNIDVPGTLDCTGAGTFDSTLTVTGLISADGKVKFPAGTAALPSFYSGTDTDTGLYFSAANEISVSTGGTQRVVVDASGQVGLGTSSPGARLEVKGASAAGYAAQFTNSSESRFAKIYVDANGIGFVDDNFDDGIEFASNTARIYANGSERMRIDSSGRLLVGTTSNYNVPATIAGAATNVSTGTGSYAVLSLADTSSAATGVGGGVAFQGNDGVNTLVTFSQVQGFKENSSSGNYAGAVRFSTRVNGSSLTEKARITSDGKLLVGTTSVIGTASSAKLHIADSSGPEINLGRSDTSVSSGNDIGGLRFFGNDSNGTYQVCASIFAQADGDHATGDKPSRLVFSTTADGASSVTERLRIDSSGNVGIGTNSPGSESFVVQRSGSTPTIRINAASTYEAQLKLQADGAATDTQLVAAKTDGSLAFSRWTGAAYSERMRISSDGTVGIGCTPNRKLQVEGASGGNGQVLISTAGAFSGTDTADLSFRIYANPSNGNAHNPQTQIQTLGRGNYSAALLFKTAVGGSDNNAPTERMRIESSGSVGIGISSPSAGDGKLSVLADGSGAGTGNTRLFMTGYEGTSGNAAGLWFGARNNENTGVIGSRTASGNIAFETYSGGWGERMRLDNSGRLLVGTSTAQTLPTASRFQVSGNDFATSSIRQTRFESGASGASIVLAHARGSEASNEVLNNNDEFGKIRFYGHDGTDFANFGAEIKAEVDGTPGSDDMPGRLVFSTTADGASSVTEAMRIDSKQRVTVKAGAIAEIDALTDAATITPDLATSCNFSVTLGGNRTLANPSNCTAGQSGSIFVTQDGTGSRTLAFGSYWDFAGGTAPTLTTTASAVDRIDYIVRTSTSIHAVATLAYS